MRTYAKEGDLAKVIDDQGKEVTLIYYEAGWKRVLCPTCGGKDNLPKNMPSFICSNCGNTYDE